MRKVLIGTDHTWVLLVLLGLDQNCEECFAGVDWIGSDL